MWSKVPLRARITFLTMLSLLFTIASLTFLINITVSHTIHIVDEWDVDNIEAYLALDVPEGIEFDTTFPFHVFDSETVEVYHLNPEAKDELRTYSIMIAGAFVIIGIIIAYLISVQSLKPVKLLAEKIETIDANSLSTLLEQPQSNDEIARLANSFNSMLGKLNRSFERQKLFSQNAAHELKTPLTSILTNIEVLQMDDEPSCKEYKDVIDTVKVNTEHLVKLVDGLLSINAVFDETNSRSFSGRDMFQRIISDLDVEIKKKNLKISIIGDCHIKGDEILLTRAYQNLIHNAVRYNVKDGIVDINLSDENIIIEDSGIGIPAKDLENIFEPLYCVDKSRSKNLGGHGLGLTIAKSIFDKSQIKIRITSEPGVGTKIYLGTVQK